MDGERGQARQGTGRVKPRRGMAAETRPDHNGQFAEGLSLTLVVTQFRWSCSPLIEAFKGPLRAGYGDRNTAGDVRDWTTERRLALLMNNLKGELWLMLAESTASPSPKSSRASKRAFFNAR